MDSQVWTVYSDFESVALIAPTDLGLQSSFSIPLGPVFYSPGSKKTLYCYASNPCAMHSLLRRFRAMRFAIAFRQLVINKLRDDYNTRGADNY